MTKRIILNENTNCPNCGAPVTEDICPYCRTKLKYEIDVDIERMVNSSLLSPNEAFELYRSMGGNERIFYGGENEPQRGDVRA